MVESVVSAAASRIGKRVLHIDRNDYYGGQWASFNLDAIQKLQDNKNTFCLENVNELINAGENVTEIGNELFNIPDFTCKWHIPRKEHHLTTDLTSKDSETESKIQLMPDDPKENWYQEDLLKDSRKFNIDLVPKLHFARGDFVELLISSNIARYSEYRSVSRVLTWLNGQLETVPCSRSDVFANSKVSVIEKRMLMKLLTSMDNTFEELNDYENKTFRTFLKDKKLTPNLIHYVLYAISMSTDSTLCHQGIENTKRFLNSLGRFGKTPFLFSMYGSGETTQAFCRLSAVFGGIYALGQPLNGLIFLDNKFRALLVGKQRIKANYLIMGTEKCPKNFVHSVERRYISRAVFITDKSLMGSEKEHLTLLLYPPEDNKNSVTIIELGSLTGTCPKNMYIVHLISRQITTPEEDFKHIVNNLFNIDNVIKETKPYVLWSSYFSLPDVNNSDLKQNIPKNIFICPGPDMDLDYDSSVKSAKHVFSKMYPDCEFLPRAPDPEEIIIEGEDEVNEGAEYVKTEGTETSSVINKNEFDHDEAHHTDNTE